MFVESDEFSLLALQNQLNELFQITDIAQCQKH